MAAVQSHYNLGHLKQSLKVSVLTDVGVNF